MLLRTAYRSPEVEEYIEGHLIQYVAPDTDILIQHATLGYRLSYHSKYDNTINYSFIGERITDFDDSSPYVYINIDALFINEPQDEDWSTISYGYSDVNIAYCRKTFSKNELSLILDTKMVDVCGRNIPLLDTAIMEFLGSVDGDHLTVESVIQKMMETGKYPFTVLPKKVLWLN